MGTHESKRGGQALIELALAIPFLLLIIANVVNYGGMFYAAITIANAARHGSQNYVYGSATIKNAATPTRAQVWAMVQNDLATLPNQDSIVVRICLENRNDPADPACGGNPGYFGSGDPTVFTEPPIDVRTEGSLFLNGWVDVGYVYEPYIPLFTVPVLGVPLSPPPHQIVRQSLMRVLN